MISPSSSPAVPLFHPLGNGTVEQDLSHRNTAWNTSGTFSLKALANKVLLRNTERNICGTTTFNSVPPMPFCSTVCGTRIEDDVLYEFNERAAILEYEAGFSREEAERLARAQIEESQKTLPTDQSEKTERSF